VYYLVFWYRAAIIWNECHSTAVYVWLWMGHHGHHQWRVSKTSLVNVFARNVLALRSHSSFIVWFGSNRCCVIAISHLPVFGYVFSVVLLVKIGRGSGATASVDLPIRLHHEAWLSLSLLTAILTWISQCYWS